MSPRLARTPSPACASDGPPGCVPAPHPRWYLLRMTRLSMETWAWIGGAGLVVLGVLFWLWFDQPEPEVIPNTYGFGVL